MPTGKIILLNGSSSAGKTTLAITLQQLLPEPWHHIALDQFRDGMAGRYRGLNSPPGTPGARGLNVVPVPHGNERVTEVQFGDLGKQVLRGMRRAIAAFAREGNNVIIDDLMFEPEFLFDYIDVLAGLEVLFVGVRCSLDVVNAREAKRPGRFPGTATSHFHRVHTACVYDIEVDTSSATPRECAAEIVARLSTTHRPQAFDKLRERQSAG
jgi:chloramphenicol 3-O phosphotransferase